MGAMTDGVEECLKEKESLVTMMASLRKELEFLHKEVVAIKSFMGGGDSTTCSPIPRVDEPKHQCFNGERSANEVDFSQTVKVVGSSTKYEGPDFSKPTGGKGDAERCSATNQKGGGKVKVSSGDKPKTGVLENPMKCECPDSSKSMYGISGGEELR